MKFKKKIQHHSIKRNISSHFDVDEPLKKIISKIDDIDDDIDDANIDDDDIDANIDDDNDDIIFDNKHNFNDVNSDNDEWQKKEIEKREKYLKQKFINVIDTLSNSKDRIKEIVNDKKTEFVGRQLRINVPQNELDEMCQHIESMNFQLGKARTMLDSYIRFRSTTPDFRPINNLIYELNEFIVESQKSIFFQQHMIKNNKRYFIKLDLQDKIHQISFLIERILGTMETGGDFSVDIIYTESEKRDERDMDRFGRFSHGGYDDISGYGGYNAGYGGWADYPYRKDNYKKQHEWEQRRKTVKEAYKDFGEPGVKEIDINDES